MSMKYVQQGIFAAVCSIVVSQSGIAATPVDFSSLVQTVSPAVVRVNVSKKLSQEELLQQQMPELLRRFFGNNIQIPNQRIPQEQSAYGSAFFITKDGYLLTNHHVVSDASKVTITLNDRREIDAELVGSDARTDVAVLKVKGSDFPALRTGDANRLKVGEPVLAIGSPFGFDYSASAGIVSAKSRTMSRENAVPFIQTDVALNPGNSGGPLFNQQGEVVGINSRIFSGTGGYMGLSFSIPIDVAMDVANQIIKTGKVSRAYLGVMLQDIDRNLAEAYELSRPEGALVTQVSEDTPASKAGLKAGDIILAYNGTTINRTTDLINLINRTRPNQTATMVVQRNNKQLSLSAMLTSAPDDTPAAESMKTDQGKGPSLGMQLRDLTPAETQSLKVKGVVITDVLPGGLAAHAGLLPGDVITRLNNTETPNAVALLNVIRNLPLNRVVRVAIQRDGVPAIVGLRVE
ncbi:serine protease [Alkanindiges hydrocarboniclasticus]|uniref:Probable periplasmic serine endoprotease DegP-like n=1 Tax=Alkanindiges hydrocarboniclasticus TaxID=1907941 RepID=A0A1S8CYK9_9GAMM|nr:Do family serine endopeptidase [Alkanindiges hydrocarboniclasticus]ONG41683.1 serine protease [Alkanindiges hydrocarboniclasticus]